MGFPRIDNISCGRWRGDEFCRGRRDDDEAKRFLRGDECCWKREISSEKSDFLEERKVPGLEDEVFPGNMGAPARFAAGDGTFWRRWDFPISSGG